MYSYKVNIVHVMFGLELKSKAYSVWAVASQKPGSEMLYMRCTVINDRVGVVGWCVQIIFIARCQLWMTTEEWRFFWIDFKKIEYTQEITSCNRT